jgi:serine O-acetyltransferase
LSAVPPAPEAGGGLAARAIDASGRSALAVDAEKCCSILYPGRGFLFRILAAWTWDFQLHCIAVYRLGQLAFRIFDRNRVLGLVPVACYLPLQFLVRLIHKVEISPRAQIGPGFFIGHPVAILIGPAAIGSNCSIGHNVTIGIGIGAQRPGVPAVGHGVWIGAGATLAGAITVGDGATIGAGAIVSQDVPQGALVLGNPARVVLARYDNRRLLGYPPREASAADALAPGDDAR